jgi:myo-inositol-1(or 4)-monophosphatase
MSAERRLAVAERAARAGGRVAAERFRTDLAVETKRGKTDLVTDADRAAQQRVVEAIHRAYPGETVVGEEEGTPSTLPEEGVAWGVDPIDGTTNYVAGNPQWTTAVAAVRGRRPVAAVHVMPAVGDVYVAGEDRVTLNGAPASVSDRRDPETFAVAAMMGWGYNDRAGIASICGTAGDRFGHLRRYGTGQTTLSMVAAGQLDGGFTVDGGSPWDRVSGAHMVERAGGTVTDLDGVDWSVDATGMVASNGAAHGELLAAVEEIREERNAATHD